MSDIDVLKRALQEHRVVTITYDSNDPNAEGFRDLECHALGFSSDNNILLRAFQTDGVSASGEPVNWKLFRVDRIKSIELKSDIFGAPRIGYRKGDKAMKSGIILEL